MLIKAKETNGINFFNGDFETYGTKGWIPYKGTSSDIPISPFTPSTKLSIVSSGNDPLFGSSSGLISKASGDARGEGVYFNFTIDEGVKNSIQKISFYYKTNNDYVDYDIIAYVVDGSNNIIDMLPLTKNVNTSVVTKIIKFSSSNSYRLYFHVASINPIEYQIKVDEINIERLNEKEKLDYEYNRTLHIQHKLSGINNSGTFTAGAWRDRPLNFIARNTLDNATLNPTTGRFTLPPGRYNIQAQLMGFYVNAFIAQLFNETNNTIVLTGDAGLSHPEGGYNNSYSHIFGEFEIFVTSTFYIRMWCQTTRSNDGFGYRASTLSGDDAIYADVIINDINSLRGKKGEKGDTGTIQIGTVIPGENPQDANVENVGTPSSAILNFTLPKGDPGTTVPDVSQLSDIDSIDWDNDSVLVYDASSNSHKKTRPNNIIKPDGPIGVKKLVAKTHYGGNGVLTFNNDVITFGQKYGANVCALFDGAPTTDATYQSGYVLQKPAGETGNLIDCDMWVHGGCALYDSGNFYIAGYNINGNLGLGDTVSRAILTLSNINVTEYRKPIQISHEHNGWRMFIKKTDGFWYGTGFNTNGALGIGNATNQTSWQQIPNSNTFTELWNLGTSYGCTVVRRSDGSVWATGFNATGQLGINNTTQQNSFIDISSAWGILPSDTIQVTGEFGHATPTASNVSTLAILINGLLKMSGNNSWGQLGQNNTTQSNVPVAPIGLPTNIKKIYSSGGQMHIFALTTDDKLYGWGHNTEGELGLGTTSNVLIPTLVNISGETVDEVFSDAHSNSLSYLCQSFLRTKSGKLFATGHNANSQLGLGDTTQRNAWVQVPFEFEKYGKVIDVSWNGFDNGGYYLLFLTDKGYVFASGFNGRRGISLDGQTTNKSVLTLMSFDYVIGKKGDKGEKGSSGNNATIQIGTVTPGENPQDANVINSGTDINAVLDFVLPKGDPGISAPDVSQLTEIDTIDWENDAVLIYDASAESHKKVKPNNIIKPDGPYGVKRVISRCHYGGTGLLTFNNDVITFGQKYGNNTCSLFDGAPTTDGTYQGGYVLQKPAGETGNLVNADMWVHGGCALYDTGNFYTTGHNSQGVLGVGDTNNRAILTLSSTNVVEYRRPEKISYEHSEHRLFIKKTDGFWYGTGYNLEGALGVGDFVNKTSWTQLTSLGTNVRELWNLGARYGCTVVQLINGSVWITGFNGTGQFGNGTTTRSSTFINISSNWNIQPSEIVLTVGGGFGMFETGANNSSNLAMLISSNGVDGRVMISGHNGWGALGQGNTTQSNVPVAPIGVPTSIKKLESCGGAPTSYFALTSDNQLWLWGHNGQGQLGDNSTTSRAVPLNMTISNETIVNIFAEYSANTYPYRTSSFLQTQSGKIFATGYNPHGQLGTGDTTQRQVWTEIPFDTKKYGNWIDVVGHSHPEMWYVALTDKGYAFASGFNGRRGFSLDGQSVNKSTFTYLDISNLFPKKGDKGDRGSAGSIQIGNVTPGENPQDANVENVGTNTEAILNFTLPKGDPGTVVPDMSQLTPIEEIDTYNDIMIIYDTSSGSHKSVIPERLLVGKVRTSRPLNPSNGDIWIE